MLRRLLEALRGGSQPPAAAPGRRALNLPLAPCAAHAPALAARIVEVTQRVEGVGLDYSPASLKWVDARILHFREDGQTFNDVGETVFLFGCYAGEVLARDLGGQWSDPGEPEHAAGFAMPGVRTPGGTFWNPIGKAIRLLENGPADSLHHLWMVARGAGGRDAA